MLKMLAVYRLAPHTEVESALAGQRLAWTLVEKVFDAGSPAALDLAFSPDGTPVVGVAGDGEIAVWDVDSGGPRGVSLVGHEGRVGCLLFSPDGKRLISGARMARCASGILLLAGPWEHRCGNWGRWWEWRLVWTGRDLLRGDRARSGYGMVFPVKRSVCRPFSIS